MHPIFFIIYAIFLICCCAVDITSNDKKLKTNIFYIIIVSFCVLAMFRTNAFADTNIYIGYYNGIKEGLNFSTFFKIDGEFEFGFEFLTKIIAIFRVNHTIYFLIIALLQMFLFRGIVKDSKYSICLLVFFISYFGFYFSFVILRAGFSVLLFLYGITKFQKKPMKLCLCFFVAFLFHYSVIAAIIFYFIAHFARKPLKTNTVLVVLVLVFICYYTAIFTEILVKPLFEFLATLNIDHIAWSRFISYSTRSYHEPYQIAFRYVFLMVIYYFGNKVINSDKNLKRDKRVIIIDRLYLYGIIICVFLGTGTFVGRINNFLFVLEFFYAGFIVNSIMSVPKNDLCNIDGKSSIALKNRTIDAIIFISMYLTLNIIFFYRFVMIAG